MNANEVTETQKKRLLGCVYMLSGILLLLDTFEPGKKQKKRKKFIPNS